MKRVGNLYEKIVSLENLRLADDKARKGKYRSYGVMRHDQNRDSNIFKLHESLNAGTYKTSRYHIFNMVTDAGKERTIYRLPYYPDRIMHHAIMNVMEPVWTSIFTSDTYSCIKGKGIHGALNKLKSDLKDVKNTQYCLKLDIRKFYPSIDHAILKQLIRRKIKDIKLLQLLDEIIDSATGVPIGNYLSQFFANIYLTYFDHHIKEQLGVKYYYRYADDIVILHSDKAFLHDLLQKIEAYMRDNLKLEVKHNYQVFPVDVRGIDFVGYVFRHTHIRMRKSIKQNFARKVAKLNKKENISPAAFQAQVCSYEGWAKHCNSKHLLKTLYNEKSRIRSAAS
jgi:retron-type reverse transcriptase